MYPMREVNLKDLLNRLGSISDEKSENIEDAFASSKETIELALMNEELESKKQDRRQRGEFSRKIYWTIVGYMVVVLCVLCATGAGWLCFSSPAIMITLLSTTTANVIGLFVIVTKYLFHTSSK